mgnify:FL=1|jgi:hypothetical protein
MRIFRRSARLRSLLLLLFLMAAAPLAGLDRESAVDGSGRVETATVGVPANAADPIGTGVKARIGCLLCASAFLAAGGTSILGVAVTALAFPELAAACGVTCAYAFE